MPPSTALPPPLPQQGLLAKFGFRQLSDTELFLKQQSEVAQATGEREKRLEQKNLHAQLAQDIGLPWPQPSRVDRGRPSNRELWDHALSECVRQAASSGGQPKWWQPLLAMNLKAGAPPRDWDCGNRPGLPTSSVTCQCSRRNC